MIVKSPAWETPFVQMLPIPKIANILWLFMSNSLVFSVLTETHIDSDIYKSQISLESATYRDVFIMQSYKLTKMLKNLMLIFILNFIYIWGEGEVTEAHLLTPSAQTFILKALVVVFLNMSVPSIL